MTVKIIDPNPQPEAVKRVTCRNCGVLLEYTRNDTREEKRTDYTGDTDTYRVLDCPNCKEKLTVPRF